MDSLRAPCRWPGNRLWRGGRSSPGLPESWSPGGQKRPPVLAERLACPLRLRRPLLPEVGNEEAAELVDDEVHAADQEGHAGHNGRAEDRPECAHEHPSA